MGIFDIFKSEKEEKDYYPNGQLKSIVHLDRSGELNGPVSFYNLEGNKIMEWNYNNGICNGKITTWYSNGNKSSEGEIKENRFTGKITTWYYDSKIQSEINLKFDMNKFNENNNPGDPEYGVSGSNQPVWFGDEGILIKTNVNEFGLWFYEDGTREEMSIQKIQKKNFEYIDTLDNKNDETSLYCREN